MADPVTLREVAAAAGVSVATASRAFSRPDKVAASTRARVTAAAERLAFTPNLAAQALSTGRTGVLGVLVPDLNNPFFAGMVKGAQAAARVAGASCLVSDTDEDPSAEPPMVAELARRCDAIVLCSSRMAGDELDRAARGQHVVLVNRAHADLPVVGFDAARGVRDVVTHLRVLGHRRIGYVGGPQPSASNAERERLLQAELGRQGVELVHVKRVAPSMAGGRDVADAVLAAGVTAVLAYNDLIALGLIGRLSAYGIPVPADLSVVGWDDIEFAGLFTPALTTVRTPSEEAGRAAVSYLLGRLGGEQGRPPTLSTRLVVRDTTARVG